MARLSAWAKCIVVVEEAEMSSQSRPALHCYKKIVYEGKREETKKKVMMPFITAK